MHFLLRHFSGDQGQWFDIGLTEDGLVLFEPVVSGFTKPWIAPLADFGTPEPAPEAFVKWMSVSWTQKTTFVQQASMVVTIKGKKKILRFSGIIPHAQSPLWKAAKLVHGPHHISLAVRSTEMLYLIARTVPGSGARADEAGRWWREIIESYNEFAKKFTNPNSSYADEAGMPANDRESRITEASSHIRRGLELERDGDLVGAADEYTSALRLNPTDARVFSYRARCRGQLGDARGWVADLDSAIRLEPTEAQWYELRKKARQTIGDVKGALSDLDMIIQLTSDNIS
jgi:hypothetical protein